MFAGWLALSALKREVTLSRVLQEALGDHPAFVPVLEWQFETAPFFVECAYGGQNWLEWAEERGGLASIPVSIRLDGLIQRCRAGRWRPRIRREYCTRV